MSAGQASHGAPPAGTRLSAIGGTNDLGGLARVPLQGALAAALFAALAVMLLITGLHAAQVWTPPHRKCEEQHLRRPGRIRSFLRAPRSRRSSWRPPRFPAPRAVLGRPDGGARTGDRTNSSPGRTASPGGTGWR